MKNAEAEDVKLDQALYELVRQDDTIGWIPLRGHANILINVWLGKMRVVDEKLNADVQHYFKKHLRVWVWNTARPANTLTRKQFLIHLDGDMNNCSITNLQIKPYPIQKKQSNEQVVVDDAKRLLRQYLEEEAFKDKIREFESRLAHLEQRKTRIKQHIERCASNSDDSGSSDEECELEDIDDILNRYTNYWPDDPTLIPRIRTQMAQLKAKCRSL